MGEIAHEKLPGNVEPSSYDIHITTDMKTYEFSGHERIILVVKEHSDSITFHSKDLTIPKESVSLHLNDDAKTVVPATELVFDTETDCCTAKFGRAIEPEMKQVTLEMDFSAPLKEGLSGYYRAMYDSVDPKTGEKVKKYMGVTQFESTNARKAFPCWDEPERKATFLLTLTFDSSLTALSNMPVASEKDNGNNTKTVSFEKTPIMSTYLLAYTIGEFDKVSKKNAHGVEVSVYTPLGKGDQGRFALDMGAWCLDFYSDYFDIDFPLPKCDMIAITNFDAGAMENWGLVTYRESALLFDEAKSTFRAKRRVCGVVAHELAHQWFGNLVTMKWWNDLWLNEGFATYMQFLSSAKRFPDWGFWTQFLIEEFLDGISLDAKPSTHKINLPVSRTCEINEMFDPISYSKGASVIRMLATYVGEEKFRDGLRVYLKRHQYGNTTTSDLWKALQEVSGLDIASLMESWTDRPGFPLIHVSRDVSTGVITLSQERMYSVPPETKDKEADLTWWIPLHFDSNNAAWKSRSVVMHEKTMTFPDMPIKEGEWLKVNAGQTEFVRVMYDDDTLFDAACKAVKTKAMDNNDRIGILSDAFALSRAGYMKVINPLKVALALEDEDDPTAIDELSSLVGMVHSLFRGTDDLKEVGSKFALRVFKKLGDKIGWEPKPEETELVSSSRAAILQRLVLAEDAASIEKALSIFEDCRKTDKSIRKDLRSVVQKAVFQSGSDEQVDALLDAYRKSSVVDEKMTTLAATGSVKNDERATKLLKWAQTSGEVKTQDFAHVTTPMSLMHFDMMWNFVKEHWKWINDTFNDSPFLFGYVLSGIVSCSTDSARIEEFKKFFADKDISFCQASIQHAYETVMIRSNWLQMCRKEDIAAWINANC